MSRVPSIPPAHERTVVDQWLGGASPRQIAKTMRTKHHVPTTHTSVQRLLDRVAALVACRLVRSARHRPGSALVGVTPEDIACRALR